MRQKGDCVFIDLLNNIRIGCLTEADEELLKSRFIEITDENFPHDAVHLFAENAPANQHNHLMLRVCYNWFQSDVQQPGSQVF